MKILLLNHYFPPDTSATARMAAVVAGALSTHHDVTLLCGRPSYDSPQRLPWRLWQTERAGRLRIIRVGSTDCARYQMKWRVVNYLTYAALAGLRAFFTPCDVVLSMTDPPFLGILGAFVARVRGKPYVYNIRDLYPDMALAGKIVRPGLLTRIWTVLHQWALGSSTLVIALGEDMRARLIAKGVDPKRIAIVRDGAEMPPANSSQPPLDQEVIRAIRGEFRVVLLHAGNLGFYGAWDTLLAAARQLQDDGVGFVFVGEGAERARLESAAAEIKNVRFLPFFPASKIPSVLAAPDAHVITVRRGLEGVVVPSKMYGILAAGQPIVALAPIESDPASLGARRGFGVSADPDKPDELVAVVRALTADRGEFQRMAAAARVAAADYDRVAEHLKFVRFVEEVCQA
jgi:putative colanic acid biosynthesis glycosyltransferase WcaI